MSDRIKKELLSLTIMFYCLSWWDNNLVILVLEVHFETVLSAKIFNTTNPQMCDASRICSPPASSTVYLKHL